MFEAFVHFNDPVWILVYNIPINLSSTWQKANKSLTEDPRYYTYLCWDMHMHAR